MIIYSESVINESTQGDLDYQQSQECKQRQILLQHYKNIDRIYHAREKDISTKFIEKILPVTDKTV